MVTSEQIGPFLWLAVLIGGVLYYFYSKYAEATKNREIFDNDRVARLEAERQRKMQELQEKWNRDAPSVIAAARKRQEELAEQARKRQEEKKQDKKELWSFFDSGPAGPTRVVGGPAARYCNRRMGG